MVIIKQKTLHDYCQLYPAATTAIIHWAEKTEIADWKNLSEIKQVFNSVDYVGDNRYVFNINGNQYRLVALIFFTVRTVYIRWFGPHKDYDNIDVAKI